MIARNAGSDYIGLFLPVLGLLVLIWCMVR